MGLKIYICLFLIVIGITNGYGREIPSRLGGKPRFDVNERECKLMIFFNNQENELAFIYRKYDWYTGC